MSDDLLLEQETAFFEREKQKLLRQYKNRFLLIKGEKVIKDFADRPTAVDAGVEKFGAGPFLVRQPGEEEPVFDAPAYTLGMV